MSLRVPVTCLQLVLILPSALVLVAHLCPYEASAQTVHDPIVITGDGDFTAENGVVSGDGTSSNPYMIEGWQITVSVGDAVRITDTTAHFVLCDLLLQCESDFFDRALDIERCANWTLRDSTLSGPNYAVAVRDCSDLSIVGNTFAAGSGGVFMYSDTGALGPYDIPVYQSCRANLERNSFESGSLYVNGFRDVTIAENVIGDPGLRAISISHCDLVNISWNDVSDAAQGIECYICTNVIISSNSVTSCSESGISIVCYSDRVVVEGNDLQGNAGSGLKLEICSNLTVTNNTFTGEGISLITSMVYSDAWTITSDNTVNGLPVLFVQGENGIDVDGAVAGQVIIAESANVTLRNMVVSDAGRGVQVVTCDGVRMENVTATGCSLAGMLVSWSNDCAAVNCNLGLNAVGLADYANSDTNVSGCSFDSNVWSGIEVHYSSFFRMSQCDFYGGWNGVHIESTQDASIDGCAFRNQTYAGISLYSCGCGYGSSEAVLIDSNQFVGGYCGVTSWLTEEIIIRSNLFHNLELGVEAVLCTGFVYWNNFTDNEIHALASVPFNGIMNWNLSYPFGGNYWDNYTGVDEFSGPDQNQPGPDGIGDTPHVMDADNMDYYPLMDPLMEPPNTPPTASFTVSPPTGYVNAAFSVDASSSSDAEDDLSELEVRWDWESDGVWDTSWTVVKTDTHLYSFEGTHTITLEVRDTNGLTDNTTRQVTVVLDEAPPVANAGPDQTVTEGDTVEFDGSGSSDSDGTIAAYEWTFTYDGETKTLTGESPEFTFEIVGEYDVTLTVTDSDGATDTDTVTVVVEEAEDEGSFIENHGLPLGIVVALAVIAVMLFLVLKGRKGGGAPTGYEKSSGTELTD